MPWWWPPLSLSFPLVDEGCEFFSPFFWVAPLGHEVQVGGWEEVWFFDGYGFSVYVFERFVA